MYEDYPWQEISTPVIGVDEVGRGCLAGPVYAAAVLLKPEDSQYKYRDSKSITASRRKSLSNQILEKHSHCIAFASVEEITELNILGASLLAMKRAVESLDYRGATVLIDGNQKIPGLKDCEQITLVKGDMRAAPVAAASIIAKVARDELMIELSEKHPQYGFEKHKGYCTKIHKEAIAEHGPCHWHRPTFAGVREHL